MSLPSVKQCDASLAAQIVRQQAAESKTIEETDKRIEVLTRIADFLWIQDEPAARVYFAEAFQVAQDRFREKGTRPNCALPLTARKNPPTSIFPSGCRTIS